MRISFAIAALVCAATARAQAALTPTTLNGEWTGTLALDNSSPRIAAVFELTDSSFAGKVYTDGTLFGDMLEGSIRGNKVHFKVDRLDFTGTVVGARMNVDLIVYNGSTRKLTLTKTPPTKPDTAIGIERVASMARGGRVSGAGAEAILPRSLRQNCTGPAKDTRRLSSAEHSRTRADAE